MGSSRTALEGERPAVGGMPDDLNAATRAAYRSCTHIVRKRAKNFYLGLRLTPEPKRSALFAVYAWMRAADDVADAPLEPGLSRDRLAEFRETTRSVLQGNTTRGGGASDGVWLAFIDTVRRFHLRSDEFMQTLDALELDIDGDEHASESEERSTRPRFKSYEGLEDYCYGVASTVGIICTRIWGIRDHAVWDEARPLAIDRGYAFQFTNILRDIREDFEAGRVYLPEAVLGSHGLTPLQLATWAKPRECAACVREVAYRAKGYYERSQRLDEIVHPDGARPLWAMTRTYSELLDRIIKEPSSVSREEPVSLPARAKLSILASAMLKHRAQSSSR